MAHEINIVNGQASIYLYAKPAWHNLGEPVDTAQDAEGAMQISNTGWEVGERSVQVDGVTVPGYKSLLRLDTMQVLSIMRSTYKTRQNREHYEAVQQIIGSTDVTFESAGALGKGERVWCLAHVPGIDYSIGDDTHKLYLLAAWSHDGSIASTWDMVDTRVVCANTLRVALGRGGKDAQTRVKVKHTSDSDAKFHRVVKIMAGAVESADDLKAKMTVLAERMVTKETMEETFNKLFPVKDDQSKLSKTRREGMLNEILLSYELNDNNAFPTQRGTAYNLLNAITNYTDHVRGTRKTDGRTELQARSESALFGSGVQVKQDALEIILQTTANAPLKTRTVYSVPDVPSVPGSLLDAIISQN